MCFSIEIGSCVCPIGCWYCDRRLDDHTLAPFKGSPRHARRARAAHRLDAAISASMRRCQYSRSMTACPHRPIARARRAPALRSSAQCALVPPAHVDRRAQASPPPTLISIRPRAPAVLNASRVTRGFHSNQTPLPCAAIEPIPARFRRTSIPTSRASNGSRSSAVADEWWQ